MLTPEELGLERITYDALIATRDLLRSGKVRFMATKLVALDGGTHAVRNADETPEPAGEGELTFNMKHWSTSEVPHDCGTCCCIWGHAELLAGFKPDDDGPGLLQPDVGAHRTRLYELIVPAYEYAYRAHPERAADEIDNYLNGRAVWAPQ